MTTMTSSAEEHTASLSPRELTQSLSLLEVKPGKHVSYRTLAGLLPDVETALFFAKAYDLDYHKLSTLVAELFSTNVVTALMEGDHSTMLQDYLVETVPDYLVPEPVSYSDTAAPPQGEILPELWEQVEIEVAQSIKDVASKLSDTLDLLPSKQGQMMFRHLAKLNKQRPTVGTYGPVIHHQRVTENLVVLDVSGSMTEGTIRRIVEDVVALSYKANAHLAIVSNDSFHWEPGTYGVKDVLAKAQYGGTYYETLTPLLDRDWGTVVTIADYDSSEDAKRYIGDNATGRIGTVLDISLVNRPTFLAQCLGQLAGEVKPLLIARSRYPLGS